MDLEREAAYRRLRIARVGLACVAIGVGLLYLSEAVFTAFLLTFLKPINELMHSPFWDWAVGSPITWATVLGSLLLLARSAEPSWLLRAGPLFVMNFVDLILWAISHEKPLGLRLGEVGHDWFRQSLASGMGWVEFLLFASLAAEIAAGWDDDEAPLAVVKIRAISTVGLVFWLLTFTSQTDWDRGWPIVRHPIRLESLLLTALGTAVLSAVASFLVAKLCFRVSVQCGRVLAEMDKEDQAVDVLRSRSESGDDAPDYWSDDPWR